MIDLDNIEYTLIHVRQLNKISDKNSSLKHSISLISMKLMLCIFKDDDGSYIHMLTFRSFLAKYLILYEDKEVDFSY